MEMNSRTVRELADLFAKLAERLELADTLAPANDDSEPSTVAFTRRHSYSLVPYDLSQIPKIRDELYAAFPCEIPADVWDRWLGTAPSHLQNIPIFHNTDGTSFILTGYAGNAAPGGIYSTVMCEHRRSNGDVTVMRYRRLGDNAPDNIEALARRLAFEYYRRGIGDLGERPIPLARINAEVSAHLRQWGWLD